MTREEMKRIRKALGLSQSELAYVIHVNPVSISRLESGVRSPSAQTALMYRELDAGWNPEALPFIRKRKGKQAPQ